MGQEFNANYDKVQKAIQYLGDNFQDQPSLEDISSHVHLSPFHFQRLFVEWAGVSPKKYLQFLSLDYAKKILRESQKNLYETALDTGLSGSSRLHDLFVNIEGMTPKEYKESGANLVLDYSFSMTPFGEIIVASTEKGICFISFCDNHESGVDSLLDQFPNAKYQQRMNSMHKNALSIFHSDWSNIQKIKLHLKGTEFQLKVWQALLSIPEGQLNSYGDIASRIGKPSASRPVGSAIGKNPIAFLIPCHRVIQSSGQMGGYRWNEPRKRAMIGWEAARYSL